ncbi:hypothetical protein [Naasia lichenicola]|uniref:hypothetical protein n=1 Tax=Naasia lichenicola TaxID=2565933 RepID=UPI00130E25B9|nr:hypothetical protein [Naasia lichenicola]
MQTPWARLLVALTAGIAICLALFVGHEVSERAAAHSAGLPAVTTALVADTEAINAGDEQSFSDGFELMSGGQSLGEQGLLECALLGCICIAVILLLARSARRAAAEHDTLDATVGHPVLPVSRAHLRAAVVDLPALGVSRI